MLAQPHSWVRTNPGGGGAFEAVEAGPTGVILVGSDLSGAYRSADSGRSWQPIGAANGLTETHISAVSFHSSHAGIAFLGTEWGIFRSTDTGKTFMQVLDSGYITSIRMSPSDPKMGYAAFHPDYDATAGRIYRTTDTGQSWHPVSINLPAYVRIRKVVVDPDRPHWVYVLTGEDRFACSPARLFKSTDSGRTWAPIFDTTRQVLDFAIAPGRPDTLYLTTMHADCNAPYYWTNLDGALYRSRNGGISWDSLSDYTGVILPDPTHPPTLRLIDPREPFPWNARAGTFTSRDGGYSFSRTGNVLNWDVFFNQHVYWCYGTAFSGIANSIGRSSADPYTYFWVTTQWVFASHDSGRTFQNVFTREVRPGWWQSRGLDNVNVLAVSISPADPDIIYAGYFDIGLWRSIDGGISWQSCNDSAFTGSWEGHGGNTATVMADPDRPGVVWASQSENQMGEYPTYLIKSTDTGQTWTVADSGLPRKHIMGLSVDPNSAVNQRTLFVTADRDVYRSTNDGTVWTKVFDCNGCRFTAVDPVHGNVIYAGGEAGVFRSLDGGTTWANISHPDMPASGTSFWDWEYEGIFDVQTDPVRSGYVYVVVLGPGKGLYRSTDSGTTWTHIFQDDFLRKVAAVPAYPHYLYATSSSAFYAGGYDSSSHGIYFSPDDGQTWTRQNQGMPYPFALALDVSHAPNPDIIVGCPGTGYQISAVPGIPTNIPSPQAHTVLSSHSDGALCVNLPPAKPTFHLTNILGQDMSARISIRSTGTCPTAIDISDLPSGIYVLRIPNAPAYTFIKMR